MPTEATFTIAADHPALAGHFPGNPIVPGVLVLEHVQQMLEADIGPVRLTSLPQVKFLSPLRPGEPCAVAFTQLAGGSAQFDCHSGTRAIARGSLRFEADAGRAG
jgi:3-hydroxymyristoyl/3-hydroxydecanoyl-(acyl carrier protein) dehydratase